VTLFRAGDPAFWATRVGGVRSGHDVIVVIMAPLGLVDVGADVRVRVGEPLAVTMQIAAERLIGEGLVDHPRERYLLRVRPRRR
jgi:hypothetical protein